MGPATDKAGISIASINIENIKSNVEYLKQLLEKHSIVCIQEHWLYSFEKTLIDDMIPDCSYAMKCSDDDSPISHKHKPKGVAGVAILWRKEFDHAIQTLPDGSSRLNIIQVNTCDRPLILINTYMPAEGSHDKEANFSSILDEIYEITEKYSADNTIIWAGDMNASIRDRPRPTRNDKLLSVFYNQSGFNSEIAKTTKQTYHHFSGNATSQIDHIMSLKSQENVIEKVYTDEHNPNNVSSHSAIIAETSLIIQKKKAATRIDPSNYVNPKPKWDKVDIAKYKEQTDSKLECLINTGGLQMPSEVLIDRINKILISTAAECGAYAAPKKKRKTKRTWNSDMKPLVQELKEQYWLWKNDGKSPSSPHAAGVRKARKALRAAQRQKAASYRTSLQRDIMRAHQGDKLLFYKLVKKQRGQNSSSLATIKFGDEVSQLEGWAGYFQDLATPYENPMYDEEYKLSRELKLHLLHAQELPQAIKPTSEVNVAKFIASLKDRKAADVYGLTAEHLKHSSKLINTVVTSLTNKVLEEQKFPAQCKLGKVVPVHKKGKPVDDPNGHRRITINSIVGKVIEKEMVARTKHTIKEHQHKLQFGFTEGCSPSNCALIITEAIAEAKDAGSPLFITMMDARKAFDVVWQESVLVALNEQGITGPLWKLYANFYDTVTSRICLDGMLSREIIEKIGIKQGAESSTGVFITRTNPTLDQVAKIPESLRIGSIQVGTPTCADDTCLLSTSMLAAQTQLLIAQDEANRERFDYSTTKTKTILCNSAIQPEEAGTMMPLKLNGASVDYVTQETHLGLERSQSGTATPTIQVRVRNGRRAAYALMGAGMHGLNGVGPEISVTLISVYVLPVVMYGLDTMRLTQPDYKELNKLHRELLRRLQHLPISTAIPAIYLLTGSHPIEALHHKGVLSLFGNVLRREDSTEKELVMRQLAMKDLKSNSWTSLVRELLYQYDLPPAFQLAENPPQKLAWKKTVKLAISTYWQDKLTSEASQKKTLHLINLDDCEHGKVHQAWKCGDDPLQVVMASTKVRLMVQRYPLSSTHCAGKYWSEECILCGGPAETVSHFILECPRLEKVRKPHFRKIVSLLEEFYYYPCSGEELIKAVLDCTILTWIPQGVLTDLEELTRKLIFQLHNERSLQLGMGSQYVAAMRSIRHGRVN